jgi:acyl dehydratase
MTVITIEKEVTGEGGQLYSRIWTRFVLRGVSAQGFQGSGNVRPMEMPKKPEREPDLVSEDI